MKIRTALTIGKFDGFHKGHRYLLSILKERSKNLKCIALVLNMPEKKRILPFKKNIKLIQEFGVKTFALEFESIKNMQPYRFVEEILVHKLNVALVVVGCNFKFGFDRSGNIELLKKLGKIFNFRVDVLPLLKLNGQVISSTLIKHCINIGEIEKARKLLGYFPIIGGKCVKGKGMGRVIGAPTINIQIDKDVIIPKNGVYVSQTMICNRIFNSLLYIGRRPTFKGKSISVEVHVLNKNDIPKGEEIEVKIIKRLRDEMFFKDPEELKKQIKKDKKMANEILKLKNNSKK